MANTTKWMAKLFKDWKVVMVKDPRGPEGSQQPMAINTLVDRMKRNTTFMDIVVFGEEAEKIIEATQKDDEIEVRGFIASRSYTDSSTGKRRISYSLHVRAWRKVETLDEEWAPEEGESVPF